MWSITSYFNPVRYKRRLANYKVFREQLATPLVTVELSFDGSFELGEADADILIQISGGAVVWQKERLLNLAVKSVPPDVSNIAWLDCDIVFDRPDWIDVAEKQLNEFNVVQLYSDLVDLLPDCRKIGHLHRDAPATGLGIVDLVNKNRSRDLDISPLLEGARSAGRCTGAAWAARREILENHGVYDAMIAGGGDKALVGALYGHFEQMIEVCILNTARRKHYLEWARPYHEAVGDRIGLVSGRIYNLWHGDMAKRGYRKRQHSLASFDFDPSRDLMIGSNGAWQWAQSKPDLAEFLENYFASRAEDG